jgi:tyrosyl-tRNA synthetase
MRVPDSLVPDWYRLVMEQELDPAADALEAKLELARFVVRRSHGEEAAREAEGHFTRVVREGQAPEDVPEAALPPGDPIHLPALIGEVFGVSTSEARRLIAQGGVKLNGAATADLDVSRAALAGALLQVGKRQFVRLASG